MELSGLIFVALALVWAVALLPKALRHTDELTQSRAVAGASESVRVLARREVISEREARLVVTAPQVPAQRSGRHDVAPAPGAPTPGAPTPGAPAAGRAPMSRDQVRARIGAQRKAAATASRRRRFVLVALLVAVIGVGALVMVGGAPVWSLGIPVALTIAFLVLARVLARREHARWDAELTRLKSRLAATPTPAADDAAQADSSASPVADVELAAGDSASAELGSAEEGEAEPVEVHNEQGLAVVSGLEETSCFPMGLLDEVTPTTDAGSLWDPLPVTLPTYVSKPRATRSVRTIDLQAPGVSSSGHDAASSALVADAATSPPPEDLPQQATGS